MSIRYFVAICIMLFMLGTAFGQKTFSKTYHLEVGNDNRASFFNSEDASFVVGTTHSGEGTVNSALTRFDLVGNILEKNSFEDFVIGFSRSMVKTEDGFNLAGHRRSLDVNLARGLELIKVNSNLEFIEKKELFYQQERSTNFPGIANLDEEQKAVYGSFVKNPSGSAGGAYVAILDSETDSIQNEIFFRGPPDFPYVQYDVFDLQGTRDSNLLFIAESRQRSADTPTGFNNYYEIVKFSKEGEVLKRIMKRDQFTENRAILEDEDGGVYIFSQDIPFDLDTIFPFSEKANGIAKLNESIDSVLWSYSVSEKDGLYEDRGHTILGFREMQDGNLLAFGTVVIRVDGQTEGVGFIGKFTKEGEFLWVREYGIPIPEEYLSLSLENTLSSGRIEDCKELADGRILCMGENAYAIPGTSFYRELWMLMLDEEGCIEPGCGPTSILTSTHQVETFDEGLFYPNPAADVLYISEVTFDEYKVFDLMGRLVDKGRFTTGVKLGDLQSGMYVLQLKAEGKLVSVYKFVKE